MMKIHDISPLISEITAVYPGDQKFERSVAMSFQQKDNLMLSSFKTSAHIGAHTDAPNHYHVSGVGMSERPLELYFGPCQVIQVECRRGGNGSRITLRDLPQEVLGKQIAAPRVLFKTCSFPNPNVWNGDFMALSAEVIDFLASKSVRLIGIDTPSIDLSEDKILESHQAVFKNDMAILEGIVLDKVSEGRYILSALPLKILDSDASPVRAVLFEGEWESLCQ